MVTNITEVVQEKNIIILSPHYDDVVLTFGGYLDALVSKGLIHTKHIRIIHVFSRSNYQARDDKGNSDQSLKRIQYATGIRLMEDLNCLDDLVGHGNYVYELMAEKECMLREKSWKDGEVFEFPQGNKGDFEDEDWQIYERIRKYAHRWLLSGDTAILLPLGGIMLTMLFVRYLLKQDIGHGVGKILFGSTGVGLLLLMVAAACFAWIARNLRPAREHP